MSNRRSATRRAAVIVVILASGTAAIRAGTGAGHGAAATPVPSAALPESLAFDLAYGGIGAEGIDQIWRGAVSGPAPGTATIRMEYAGAPGDRRMPVWPVNAWLFFCADDYRSSFAAELSGSMNWRSGDMRVTGLVSDGVRRDTPVEQRVHLDRPALTGTAMVRFLPVSRREPARAAAATTEGDLSP